jgi:hypothetical protein
MKANMNIRKDVNNGIPEIDGPLVFSVAEL